MIIIDLPKFNLDLFLDDFYEFEKDPSYALSLTKRSGFSFMFSVNRKVVTEDVLYLLNETLRNVNNGFYELLRSGESNIALLSGEGVPEDIVIMKLKDDKIFFNTYFPEGPRDKSELHDEQSGLIQAVEEALKAVNKYKDICLAGAKVLASEDTWWFMNEIFYKEERFTFKRYDDENFDWERYYSQRNKGKKIIIHKAYNPTEASKLVYEYEFKKFHETEIHRVIRNYYEWFPLEQAWQEYKQKHNISDEDVKKAIAEEKEKERKMEKNS